MFADMTVKAFLEDLASSSPAPGGGAAAAMSGALGAGLISMVCNLTIGKKGYEDYQEEINAVQVRAFKLQNLLRDFMREDAEAFTELMESFRLPKDNEAQTALRVRVIQDAYRRAAQVPFRIAAANLEIVRLAGQITGRSNINVLSDIEVAVVMAVAGMEAGLINVMVNLPYIKDSSYVAEKHAEIEEMKKEMAEHLKVFHQALLTVKGK